MNSVFTRIENTTCKYMVTSALSGPLKKKEPSSCSQRLMFLQRVFMPRRAGIARKTAAAFIVIVLP